MSLFQLAYNIARRRIVSGWPLELVVFLGIVLSVALLSSSLVFSDLLAESALRRELQEATPQEANLWVRAFGSLDLPGVSGRASSYQAKVDLMRNRVAPLLRGLTRDVNHVLETSTFFFAGYPQLDLPNEVRPRGRFQYMTVVGDPAHTQLVAGRWPQPGAPGQAPLEVVLDDAGAALVQLWVGDGFQAFPASSSRDHAAIDVSVVGVFRRIDPDNTFWEGQERSFGYQDDRWTIVPLFTSQAGVLNQVAHAYPGMYSNVTWVFYLDREGMRARDVANVQQNIRRVRAEVAANLENGSTAIRLDRVLDRYSQQLLLARIPLFLMVFLVTGILAYYLALVASLTVRSRSAEIAMLKSRGATTRQVGLLMLVEGLLLAVPAVIIGTFVSPIVARVLGGLFFEVPAGLAPGVSAAAFLLGVGGALLAVGVLSLATLAAARRGIVEFRQAGARPATSPFILRYYLDILLLAVIGLIWWQMQSRGTFLVQSVRPGQPEIDFTLLLGPVLALLALGLLILRFFPLLLALLARVTGPLGPVWLAQGLRRVARDPLVPGSLVVLLMLATSLGVIGSAFSSTLDRSQRDRALYQAGADLKLVHGANAIGVASLGLSDLLEGLEQVEGSAEVQRLSGHLMTQGLGINRVSLLGVDTRSFDQVAWYRPDFSPGRSLPDLASALAPSPAFGDDGLRLPEDATALALWGHPHRPDSRIAIQARMRDSRGEYFDIHLGDLSARGWRLLEASLDPPELLHRRPVGPLFPESLTPPYTLLALNVTSRAAVGEPGAVFLDTLHVATPRGEVTLSQLGALEGWHTIEDHARPGLYALESSASVTRSEGRPSAVFSWAPGGLGLRGLRYGAPEEPLPALVSPGVLEVTQVGEGDALGLGMSTFTLPLRAAAVAHYFPTLDPREQPFVVVDLQSLIHYSNRHNQRIVGAPTELWVNLNSGPEAAAAVIQALGDSGLPVRETHLASELVDRRLDQPLTNASWGGLLVLMFLALVLASASGVALFSYTDTRERQTEFALLRTLGSSRGQINGVVWFSLFLVVVCGIALGTWAGQQIGATILPILEVAEGGARVTPPMILQTNWTILTASYLVLATVTGCTVAWLAWLTAKLDVQQVLRAGEAGK